MRNLFIVSLLLASCSKEECTDYVSHFTRQTGSDVIKLVETYPGSEKPKDYTTGQLKHIFIIETYCN